GMFDFASYQTEQIQLSVGDRIFLYSDGITEAESTDKEQYSEQRLALQIQQLSKLTISKQSNTIVEELNNWSGTTQFDDDISLLAFEWNGS
ncbi:PP2C family protein-serine/threonine phosphatase, partial [Shewanella sp. 0m-11]